jgi:cell division protein FtsN
MARGNAMGANNGGGQKSKAFAALIVGMVLGLAAAGFLAWYIFSKNGSAFTSKEDNRPKTPVATTMPAPVVMPAPVAASAPHANADYEFYKALPDKKEAPVVHAPVTPKVQAVAPVANAPVNPSAKAVVDGTLYWVQVGSFQNADDAEKLKAKLALLGMEATVQKADVAGKGVFHRVRLGTFKGLAETNAAIANLKLNGISNATALRAQ